MPSLRQNKASRLIQRELSTLFQREARTLFNGTMITVTVVRVTPDLKVAKAYLSFFAIQDKDAKLEEIRKQQGNISRILGTEMRHQLRYIPELHFYLDDSIDLTEEIDTLLKND